VRRQGDLRVGWVGDATRREFARAFRQIQESVWVRTWRGADDLDGLSVPPGPHLVILAVSFPGQIAASAVARLRASLPLAAVVSIEGPWCEGHRRSGIPLRGVTGVSWISFPAWFARGLAEWHRGRVPHWWDNRPNLGRLPPWSTTVAARCRDRVGIVTAATPISRPYAELLASRGIACREIWPDQFPSGLEGCHGFLWDGSAGGGRLCVSLERLAAHAGARRILAVQTGVRETQASALYAGGASAVLSKPFRVDDLLELLGCGFPQARSASEGS
jgi:hypothetical protein